ncbi:hypothetical protein BPOR_0533g00060 [Botrytis porri]|uniref:Uncharacterized protein n=1 Tax=Botrytis porri TaxID=87229 RepID=A0A4Z1KKW6_9HELO|nr:hypothetical protein BPOR_0533g00060 [Botrytis porri]
MDASRRVSLVAIGYRLLIDKDATVDAEFNGPKRSRRGKKKKKLKVDFSEIPGLEVGPELTPVRSGSYQEVMNRSGQGRARQGRAGQGRAGRRGGGQEKTSQEEHD